MKEYRTPIIFLIFISLLLIVLYLKLNKGGDVPVEKELTSQQRKQKADELCKQYKFMDAYTVVKSDNNLIDYKNRLLKIITIK